MTTFQLVARIATFVLSTLLLLGLVAGVIYGICIGSVPLIVCLGVMLILYCFGFYVKDCVAALRAFRGEVP